MIVRLQPAGALANGGHGFGFVAVAAAPALVAAGPAGWVAIGVSAGVTAISILAKKLFSRSPADQSKVDATHVAEQAIALAQQNLKAYMAGPRTRADQQAALAIYDQIWNGLVAACAQIGDVGGQRCIADREPGARWDMARDNRAPIAADPGVSDDVAGVLGLNVSPAVLLGAAVIALGVLL